jgi:hypothetical protein
VTLGHTFGALRGIGARWLAPALLGGAAVGVATCLGLRYLLPEQIAESLLPYAAGIADGLLCLLAVGSLRDKALRGPLLLVLIATAIATGYLVVMLAIQPGILHRRHFGYWAPSVAVVSLVAWVAAAVWERRVGKRIALLTAIIAGLALTAMLLNNARSVYRALDGEYIRSWNVYHYYVGAKYFEELGYTDLYAATLAADDDLRRRKREATVEEWGRLSLEETFSDIEQTRSMLTYRRISRRKAVEGFTRERFSDARWEEFGRDTRSLRPHLSSKSWRGVLTDLGFNPSPAWTVIGTPLANLIPIDRPASRLVANSDLPLLLLMFGIVWWAFGPRAAFTALLWLNLIHFNRARFAGGFLQYDWLASLVIGYALYHKGRARAAGAVYSWSLMTRVFPAFLLVPIAVKLVIDGVRGRSGEREPGREGVLARFEPRRLRFVAALVLSCGVIFGLSHLTGRGLATWPEWIDKIAHHSHLHPLMDPQRIGVGRLVLHQPNDDDPWAAARGAREQRLADARPLKWAIQAVGLILLVAALIKRRDGDAMALMLFGVFLILTLSRYYASAWVLLFLLEARAVGQGKQRWGPLLAGACLLLIGALFFLPDSRAGRYFLANYEALAMFVALCALYVVQTWRTRSRPAPDPASPP